MPTQLIACLSPAHQYTLRPTSFLPKQDPLWDSANCGACRNKCPQGQLCGNGQCHKVQTPCCAQYTEQEECVAHVGPWHTPCCWDEHERKCIDSANDNQNSGQ